MSKLMAVCAVLLWADALWPMVLAVLAAPHGDYGGLILVPPISALCVAAGVVVWKAGRE